MVSRRSPSQRQDPQPRKNEKVAFRARDLREEEPFTTMDEYLSRPLELKTTTRQEEEFICGPIPVPWLRRAADISLSAAYLASIICHLTKLRQGPAVFTATACQKYHIPQRTARRLLRELEHAGLVCVVRQQSRAPRVTVVPLVSGVATGARTVNGEEVS
jgi:hypothetical protein